MLLLLMFAIQRKSCRSYTHQCRKDTYYSHYVQMATVLTFALALLSFDLLIERAHPLLEIFDRAAMGVRLIERSHFYDIVQISWLWPMVVSLRVSAKCKIARHSPNNLPLRNHYDSQFPNGIVSSVSFVSTTNTARSLAGFVSLALALTPWRSPGSSEKLCPAS